MTNAELSRLIENIIRSGTILEVDHANALCRVQSGELQSAWLSYFTKRAGTSKTWDPPTVGEQCLILSPSGETAAGLVLVGIYSDNFNAPSNSPDEHLRVYPDGAHVSYNHATGALMATGIKTALIQAESTVTIDCPQTNFTGAVTVDGLFTYQAGLVGAGGDTTALITGDVIANGISLINHVHSGVESGGSNTGGPA